MKLAGSLVSVADVTRADRDRMFAVMDRHYETSQRDVFESDLDEKQWVIQVCTRAPENCWVFRRRCSLTRLLRDGPSTALFSGDTVTDRGHLGRYRLDARLGQARPDADRPTAMHGVGTGFLISKGYKTYRFLPVFFRDIDPHPCATTPEAQAVVEFSCARSKYPHEYDRPTGA